MRLPRLYHLDKFTRGGLYVSDGEKLKPHQNKAAFIALVEKIYSDNSAPTTTIQLPPLAPEQPDSPTVSIPPADSRFYVFTCGRIEPLHK